MTRSRVELSVRVRLAGQGVDYRLAIAELVESTEDEVVHRRLGNSDVWERTANDVCIGERANGRDLKSRTQGNSSLETHHRHIGM